MQCPMSYPYTCPIASNLASISVLLLYCLVLDLKLTFEVGPVATNCAFTASGFHECQVKDHFMCVVAVDLRVPLLLATNW